MYLSETHHHHHHCHNCHTIIIIINIISVAKYAIPQVLSLWLPNERYSRTFIYIVMKRTRPLNYIIMVYLLWIHSSRLLIKCCPGCDNLLSGIMSNKRLADVSPMRDDKRNRNSSVHLKCYTFIGVRWRVRGAHHRPTVQ